MTGVGCYIWLYVGSENSNPDPHVCMASTLLTESSLHPCSVFHNDTNTLLVYFFFFLEFTYCLRSPLSAEKKIS